MKNVLVLAVLLCLSVTGAQSKASSDEPARIKVELTEENIDGFWVHFPRNFDGQERWPVLLYLHGVGAVEQDLDYIGGLGPVAYAAEDTSQSGELRDIIHSKFIIVAPHLTSRPADFASWTVEVEILDAILDTVFNRWPGDRERLYLTGLSRGGGACWLLPNLTRHHIAAVVPVCGMSMGYFADDPRPREMTSTEPNEQFSPVAFETLPVWNTCNARDGWPTRVFQLTAVKEIEALGGEKFLKIQTASPAGTDYLKHRRIFTSFDRKGHDAWSATYRNVQIYRWLLSFSNRDGDILQDE